MTFTDTNPKNFKDESQPFKCAKCGHNTACRDTFGAIPGVKRTVPGNLICAKCFEPVQAIA